MLCGDGRTEVEGTTEDRIRDDGNLSFFVKVNDVHWGKYQHIARENVFTSTSFKV